MTQKLCSLPKLPVHLLLDIDGTLLQIIGRTNTPRCDEANATPPPLQHYLYPRFRGIPFCEGSVAALSFVCERTPERLQHRAVVVRPWVIAFLRAVLVGRQLDSPHTRVLVSLYTRQSIEYAAAVADEVLAPRVCGGGRRPANAVLHRCFGGESCLRSEAALSTVPTGSDKKDPAAPPASPVDWWKFVRGCHWSAIYHSARGRHRGQLRSQ